MTTAEYAYRTGGRVKELLASALLLSKPGILLLTAMAGFTGMVMAGGGIPEAGTGLACISSLLMAAAGSAMINGVLDARIDTRMARLKARVEALAELGRNRTLAVAVSLITLSVAISLHYLNTLAAGLILAAVVSYLFLYTLWLKRSSPFGVIPGGIPGALPVLIGYAAVAGTVRTDGVILFFIMLLWQPPHFWILSLKYREDYRNAGIPVLPEAMGEPFTRASILAYGATLVPAAPALGLYAGYSARYSAAAVALGLLFLAACYQYVARRPSYGRAFYASIWYLTLLFLAIITDIWWVG